MKDKFPKIPRIPKRIENWLRNHTVEDLEAAMWELDGKKAELIAGILSIVYDISDDIVGVEIPEIEVFT